QKSEITVRDVVVFNEEEVTEEKLEAKIRETLKLSDKVAQAHRDYLGYRKKFVELSKRSPRYPRARWKLGRLRIKVSQSIRRIEFSEPVKRRLVERVREAVDGGGSARARMPKRRPQSGPRVTEDYRR